MEGATYIFTGDPLIRVHGRCRDICRGSEEDEEEC